MLKTNQGKQTGDNSLSDWCREFCQAKSDVQGTAITPGPQVLHGQQTAASFLLGQNAGVRVLLSGWCPREPKYFFSLCRIHIPAFSRLPASGTCSQALLTMVCALRKGLFLSEENSRRQRVNWRQSPCLPELLHRAEQAGKWRKDAWPKQGWLWHT